MNKKMMDILVCPIDKHFPLEIFESKTKEDLIVEGALYCSDCSRFYPIIEEIPILLQRIFLLFLLKNLHPSNIEGLYQPRTLM
jgi:uncharacterized protein YbaR (Trm112 family)